MDTHLRLYVITGMHRSGSSALAELTRGLGAWVGDDHDLLPPAPDNPRGFFEHREFKRINDRILESFGGRWDRPPVVPLGWEDDPRLDTLRREARAFLDDLTARDGDVCVMKDPRSSLTLPFWRTVSPIEGTIVSMRSPSSVAASLLRRNGMVPAYAARLWWTYTSAAVSYDPDALLVPYGELVSDSRALATRLAAFLGLDVSDADEARGVIDPTLDHGGEPIGDDVVEAAERVHDALLTGPGQVPVGDVMALSTPASVSASESREREDARLRDRVSELKTALNRHRHQSEEHLLRLRDRTAELQRDVEFSRARIARRELELEDLKDQAAAIAELRDKYQNTSEQLVRTRSELKRLKARKSVRISLKLAQFAKPFLRTRGSPSPKKIDASARTATNEGALQSSNRQSGNSQEPSGRPVELGFDPLGADMESTVTIIVPVFDSPDETSRCLDALERNTSSPARLLIIDDASELDATRKLLARWSQRHGVTVLRNEENLGFTRTVNRGLEACDTDVVILNNDAEVTPRWLEGLRLAVGSGKAVGTATAVSDDAGAFSVPLSGQRNELPPHLGTDSAGRTLARNALWRLPSTPTGNGFCMYIRRAVIDDIGVLDADAFPVGYGEENDFCMRAGRAGWRHVVADAVLVRHRKGTTFRERRPALIEAGRAVVDERHPDYTKKVREFTLSDDMEAVREVAATALDAEGPRMTYGPRVLYMVHAGRGGTPATSLDLVAEISDRYDALMLICDPDRLVLKRLTRDGAVVVEKHRISPPVTFDEPFRDDVRQVLASIMVRHAVELVHVRHAVKATLDVFPAARALGIPYVVSFHDFYMACPTVHLLDEQNRFCAGRCTAGDGQCRIPMRWISETAPHLKHTGVYEWRELLRPHLEHAAALVTTSARAREIYLDAYPTLKTQLFHVIEHGRDLSPTDVGWSPPESGEKIRLLVPGNLDVHKGSEFLRALRASDLGQRLEIHLLGQRDDEGSGLGISHGEYEREEFADRVQQIQPHLIGIFATWAETYNHTLSEAWMTGVPVVATDIGALGERIRAHGGGFLVPHDDPAAALNVILRMVDDPGHLRDSSRLEPDALRSIAAMGEDYDELYCRTLAAYRSFGEREPLRVGVLALGTRQMAPGSVQVRSLRPLGHPALGSDLMFRHLQIDDLLDVHPPNIDLLVVQRTATPPEQVSSLLSALNSWGLPLAVDLDDLLFDERLLPDGDEDWSLHVASLRTMMEKAELVTVSTGVLADRALGLTDRVVTLPNHLDERLWFSSSAAEEDRPGSARLLYVGSRTHAADLELLKPVIGLVREQLGSDVVFDVVGGTSEDGDWFNRIPVPRGCSNYPAFAEWLQKAVAPSHGVALAPLADTPFNQAKSDLKWLEYTAMGLPGVFSRCSAYETSITDGVTGRLVSNDPWSWAEAIIGLLRDHESARTMVAAARDEIIATRTLDRRVRERLDLYRTAVDARRETRS